MNSLLTGSVRFVLSTRAAVAGSSRRTTLTATLLLSVAITSEAHATSADNYKLYAHSRIVNDKQYQCFQAIIYKENRSWRVDAKNGSHFGLGQMRSAHYRNLDGYRQIDATIKYIKVRYKTVCNAWLFHKNHGYY